MEQLYQRYGDRADFYLVYIREAHPERLDEAEIDHDSIRCAEQTLEQRAEIAAAAARGMGVTMPVLIDDMDESACRSYAAWPSRIAVIDTDGQIAWHSERGPRGFDLDRAERELQTLLSQR